MISEKLVTELKKRGFGVSCFADAQQASAYLTAACAGKSVGIGGCKTAEQMGLYELLSENGEVFWHWKVPGKETMKKAAFADVYISGANAVSETGEIINIDGTGNRLAGQVYGHEKVYIISGANKVCPDFASAVERARKVAAVRNAARFEKLKTPCKADGMCHDCLSADRICNAMLVLWAPMSGMQTEVVLIDEELGF